MDMLRSLIDQIRPFLKPYLASHGIEIEDDRTMFKCISRYHSDKDPSMHLVPGTNGQYIKCFGCMKSMDILEAAHHLERLPIDGKEFITDNLFKLCDLFSIPHDEIEFTPEEIEFYKHKRLMRDVADIFTSMIKPTYAAERGWTAEHMSLMEVGTIEDLQVFFQAIMTIGNWSKEELTNAGIIPSYEKKIPRLFGPDRLTFLIRDDNGAPVGFACRNYNKENPKPKYINTAEFSETTSAGSKVYDKSKVLYALDSIKPTAANGYRVDIFEGYADVVTARMAGHWFCAALGGTAFTTEHLNLLRQKGFRHINFVLDGDEAGISNMIGSGEKERSGYLFVASGVKNLKVTVGFLPWDTSIPDKDRDPDTFFRKFTINDYNEKLSILDAFEWELESRTKGDNFDKALLLDAMIDLLQNESNLVNRRLKAEKLAIKTKVPVDDILREHDRRFSIVTENIISDYIQKITRAKTAPAKSILAKSLASDLSAREILTSGDCSQEEVLNDFEKFRAEGESEDTAGLLKIGLPKLEEAINGLPIGGEWLGFAGNPNSGKTAIMLAMAANIVRLNKNPPSVLWFAIDDQRKAAYARFLAMMTGFSINDCVKPMRWIYKDPIRKQKYEEAADFIHACIRNGSLSFKGEAMGSTPDQIEKWILDVQTRINPKVLLFIDSFHNIDIPGMDDDRRFPKISSWIRSATQRLGFSVVSTLECNKLGIYEVRPTLAHLHGSRKMSFDMKYVGMVYNDLVARGPAATTYWMRGNEKMPIIEIDTAKNKLTAMRPSLSLKFVPEISTVSELSFGEVITATQSSEVASQIQSLGKSDIQPTSLLI